MFCRRKILFVDRSISRLFMQKFRFPELVCFIKKARSQKLCERAITDLPIKSFRPQRRRKPWLRFVSFREGGDSQVREACILRTDNDLPRKTQR